MASVYLYTPPTWRNSIPMEGALVIGFPVSTLVYRLGGTWHNQLNGDPDNPVVADCDIESTTGLLLYFTTPVVVPDALHDELAALAPADPNWTPGVLTLI